MLFRSKDISRRHISMDASAEESSGDRCILLRFTDDYLFISTSKKQAASFFSRLQRGFCEYNCYMNDDKFSHNFDIGQLSGIPSSRAYVGEDGISFLRWCGLLLNCCTSEVQEDHTKLIFVYTFYLLCCHSTCQIYLMIFCFGIYLVVS